MEWPKTIFIVVGLCEDGEVEEEVTTLRPTKELAEEAKEEMLRDDFESAEFQEYKRVD